MAELNWEGNTKEMYEALVKGTPLPFRKLTKKQLIQQLEERCAANDGKVTKDLIIESVKAITPKPFVGFALKSIKDM
jgi:hypothetical protein